MPRKLERNIHRESGTNFLEYTLALSILAIIFIAAGIYLKRSSDRRANAATNTAKQIVPCEGGLAGLPADACK